MASYRVQSPILFLIFNRPDTTIQVFEQIKRAQPSRLYIAADGPRSTRETDTYLCEQTRAILRSIDWDCEVRTLFRDENLGCKEAVSSAITWFFDQEEEGIILEDDCLPADDFFRFCDILLEKYRYDTRIRYISGCNLQQGQVYGRASYYFSHLPNAWGWASWKRVWNDYDKDLIAYQSADIYSQFLKIFNEPLLAEAWTQIFIDLKANKIDTWDYQLSIINFFNNGLAITPNVNMIKNIGFGENATHTFNSNDINANMSIGNIGEIIHPQYIIPERDADFYRLNSEFDINKKKKKQRSNKARLKRCFKKIKGILFDKRIMKDSI